MAAGILMNVVLTTSIITSDGAATSTTSFETYDDRGCEKTARMLLGNEAMANRGGWRTVESAFFVVGKTERTVRCFPKQGEYKSE